MFASYRKTFLKWMNWLEINLAESLRWIFAGILGLLLYLLAADVIFLVVTNERWAEGLRDLMPFGIVAVVYEAILKIKSPQLLAILIVSAAIGLRIEDQFSPLSSNSRNAKRP